MGERVRVVRDTHPQREQAGSTVDLRVVVSPQVSQELDSARFVRVVLRPEGQSSEHHRNPMALDGGQHMLHPFERTGAAGRD